MPGRTLPTLPVADVASKNTAKSCYVTIDTKVYDVTAFLDDHPGGGDLILEYGGKDIKEIMEDELSHAHSEAAYEILEEHHIGFVADDSVMEVVKESQNPEKIVPLPPTKSGKAELSQAGITSPSEVRADTSQSETSESKVVYEATGMSSAEDLNKETDATTDYKRHKFLDLDKPLLMQVWNGGFSKEFYLEQVHRPRHYRGGASAPLFGNFLEPLSLTPWYVVPLVWLPVVTYYAYVSSKVLHPAFLAGYWLFGLGFWTIIEYTLHRCLFHLDAYLPDNRVGITLHFLLHGIHHYLPMDKYRLVMPPTLFLVLCFPFWHLAHTVFWYQYEAATAAFSGGMFGYICYDLTHYFLHHRNLPSYYRELKKYHLQHHFADYENGFGVTSRFWDRVFKTELPPPRVLKTQ